MTTSMNLVKRYETCQTPAERRWFLESLTPQVRDELMSRLFQMERSQREVSES